MHENKLSEITKYIKTHDILYAEQSVPFTSRNILLVVCSCCRAQSNRSLRFTYLFRASCGSSYKTKYLGPGLAGSYLTKTKQLIKMLNSLNSLDKCVQCNLPITTLRGPKNLCLDSQNSVQPYKVNKEIQKIPVTQKTHC